MGFSDSFVRAMNANYGWSSEGLLEDLEELDPLGKGACGTFVEGCSTEGTIIEFEADEDNVRIVTKDDTYGDDRKPHTWKAKTDAIKFAHAHGGLILQAPGAQYLCVGVDCFERLSRHFSRRSIALDKATGTLDRYLDHGKSPVVAIGDVVNCVEILSDVDFDAFVRFALADLRIEKEAWLLENYLLVRASSRKEISEDLKGLISVAIES